MPDDRRIILNGQHNVCLLGHESDIKIYAGQGLNPGRLVVDQLRRRAYTITGQNPRVIVVKELVIAPATYKGVFPLDAPVVAGELVENGTTLLLRKKNPPLLR